MTSATSDSSLHHQIIGHGHGDESQSVLLEMLPMATLFQWTITFMIYAWWSVIYDLLWL